MKGLAEREVECVEMLLLIGTPVVRWQSGSETSAATVRWQLHTHKVTMHSSSGSASKDSTHDGICSRETHGNAASHTMRWAPLRNCRSKRKILHGDETYFASYFAWCGHVARMKSDWTRLVRQVACLCTKNNGMAAESEERSGFAMPRSTFQGLEVRTGSGSECIYGVDNKHRIGWCGAQRSMTWSRGRNKSWLIARSSI